MKQNAFTCFFESSEPSLFARYVKLRSQVFREYYPDLPACFGAADETDIQSLFVYGMQGDLMAGGARLTISTPQNPVRLPLEEVWTSLIKNPALNGAELSHQSYGEISRMAIDPESSNGFEISFALGRELCRVAARNGVDKVFSICPPAPARLNRLNAAKCGVRFEVYPEPATIFGMQMRLCAYSGLLAAYGPAREVLQCQF